MSFATSKQEEEWTCLLLPLPKCVSSPVSLPGRVKLKKQIYVKIGVRSEMSGICLVTVLLL